MTSTSDRSCTRFVPESITGGSAAGQRVADWYRSRLEMKRTTGNADQGKRGVHVADLRVPVLGGPSGSGLVRPRVVPVFYRMFRRDLVNTAGALALFPFAIVAVLAVQRQDRKTGGTR